jgi:hypothetical protein
MKVSLGRLLSFRARSLKHIKRFSIFLGGVTKQLHAIVRALDRLELRSHERARFAWQSRIQGGAIGRNGRILAPFTGRKDRVVAAAYGLNQMNPAAMQRAGDGAFAGGAFAKFGDGLFQFGYEFRPLSAVLHHFRFNRRGGNGLAGGAKTGFSIMACFQQLVDLIANV